MTDIIIIIALGLAGVLAIVYQLGRTAITAFDDGCRAIRNRAAHDRELHHEQVTRLIVDMGAERREWAQERKEWTQERSVLLSRIQDPVAGVAASLSYLPAPAYEPGALDVESDR